jgi:DNA polymerase III epsilon subunit-like protein
MYHQINKVERAERPFVCEVCSMSWVRRPARSGYCPGIRFYGWQQAPEYLQTYTQLRAKHLKPLDRAKPDACISGKDEWIYLYDERQALPRRQCSERQREVLRRAWAAAQEKYTCKRCGNKPKNVSDLRHNFGKDYCEDCSQILEWEAEELAHEDMLREDSNESIEWARSLLARNDWALIDTETTSLTGVAVEICAVAPDGTVLFHSLVQPDEPVTSGARAVHRITDEELSQAPTIAEIWPDLLKALEGRTLLLSYNAVFDDAVLSRSARRAGLSELPHKWECVMLAYAAYFGEWSHYWQSYKWRPLPFAGHRAKDDALAALDLMRRMARTRLDETEDE